MKEEMNGELTDRRRGRANDLVKAKDWPALLDHAEAWLADQPSAHYPLFYRANALWGLKRWSDAAIAFQKTKDVQPKWSDVCDEYIEACDKGSNNRKQCTGEELAGH